MPATAQTVWQALQKVGNSRKAARKVTMYAFTYHRPGTVRQAASLLAKQEEAKLLAGGHADPDHEAAARRAEDLVDLSQIEGLSGIEMTGRSLIIGAMTPHVEVATSAAVKRTSRRWPTSPARSAIPPSATAAPSAARSPTTTPMPTTRPARWGWAPPSSPTSGASRPTSSSRACSRPRSRPTRSSPRCSSPSPTRRPTRNSPIRRRATPWSACSSRSAAPTSAWW